MLKLSGGYSCCVVLKSSTPPFLPTKLYSFSFDVHSHANNQPNGQLLQLFNQHKMIENTQLLEMQLFIHCISRHLKRCLNSTQEEAYIAHFNRD
jgi:hypothetical protein